MNSKDFLDLAVRLSAGDSESEDFAIAFGRLAHESFIASA